MNMKNITITGVPEHFNFPWIKLVQAQPFEAEGITLEWKDEPKGSGAMIQAIQNNETDLAIILTESFLKYKVEENPGAIIGYHVKSPLTWGIHVPSQSLVLEVEDLKERPFMISRAGSGSHLMAFLLARQHGWDLEELKFEIIGDLHGAREAFKSQKPQAFLWEKYTTKPFVHSGEFRRVGEIPTPWPCFVIVASEKALETYPNELKEIQGLLYETSEKLLESEGLAEELSSYYRIEQKDIEAWLSQLEWATDSSIEKISLVNAMTILEELGLIDQKVPVEELVDEEFVKLE
jgi:ABC-type nitrate/sulfonate/bicarbonate transport system substrate-binding protein